MAKVFLFCFLITRVMSWTVDLGEVKKFLVDNEVPVNESSNENNLEKLENVTVSSEDIKDFGFDNFDEKEVTSIIQNGSVYLEGLSKALMSHRSMLYNCSLNSSDSTNPDRRKDNENITSPCSTAFNNTEYIQKLSELALLTTNKLRDKADEKEDLDDARDENELLLQLAWLLDRLAYLTGYEPNPKQFIKNDNLTNANISESTTENSTEPLEIMEQIENGRPLSKLPPKDLTTAKSLEKRSVEKPLENVVNFYVKYNIWNNSNPSTNNTSGDFDVENNITVRPIAKRSLKKIVILRRLKRKPEI